MRNLSNLTLRKKLLLASIAGLFNWAVFPSIGLWPLVWVCQLPLLLASFCENSHWRALLLGLVTGLVFFFGTCHWIAEVLLNYGGLPWIGAQLLFLLLAVHLSSFYALFSWAFARLSLSAARLCFWLAPALWVSAEYLRAHVLTGFPWCLVGYGLVDATNLSQISKWTGVYGLSFAAIGASAFLAEVLVRPARCAAFRLGGASLALLCITLGFAMADKEQRNPSHRVRIVQPNIGLDEKLDVDSREPLLEELRQLSIRPEPTGSNPPGEAVRLLLWPETPAAFYFNHDRDFRRRMEDVATSSGAYFFFGFVDFRPRPGNDGQRDPYNSVAAVSPQGRTVSQYDKIHLVPFGEYIPYEGLFFFVDKISTEAGNFKPGDRIVVTHLGNGHAAGTFVCYEAVVPDLVRQFTRDGSEVFINVTNDAWFGESAAPFQHLVMARMRAIENQRYLLRAANSGISAIIDPRGRVLKTVARNQRVVFDGDFAFQTQMTFYAQYGDLFAWLCLAASAGGLIWARLRSTKKGKASSVAVC